MAIFVPNDPLVNGSLKQRVIFAQLGVNDT